MAVLALPGINKTRLNIRVSIYVSYDFCDFMLICCVKLSAFKVLISLIPVSLRFEHGD